MQANTLENQIIKKDKQFSKELINQNNMIPHYTLTGSGCREIAALMKYPIYRICICFGLTTLQTNNIFSFMITASHNPGTDNGIKIGYTNGNIISKKMFKVVEQCLNSQENFQLFVSDKLKIIKNINSQKHYAFIGRDCRSSSPQLTQVAHSTLMLLGIKVINLDICSTPQLFSFSQYILKYKQIKNMEEENNIQKFKQIYVDEVMNNFEQVYNKVIQKSQKTKNKISILVDFSNGSGAISYLRYKQHLGKYFHVKQIGNKQFDCPNQKCGAQFYTKNWSIVQNDQQFKQFSQCFFFDGDSDRVICKTESCQKPFDGNYFLVFYVHVLKKIKDELNNKIKIDWSKYSEVLKLNAIGTSFTNLGVKLCLKKIDINLEISEVGTLNLFRSATQLEGITVFFEPNGHGGVYFSQSSVKLITQMKQLYPDVLQCAFLNAMHNILKNNSRGYGLHNMLTFFLCKKYLNHLTLSDLIIFAEEDKKSLYLKPEYDKLFKNGVSRNNQLSQPNQIALLIDQLRKRYEDYQITTRKSQTQKYLVRIITQGLNINICKEINRQIQQFFNNFGYLSQKIIDH